MKNIIFWLTMLVIYILGLVFYASGRTSMIEGMSIGGGKDRMCGNLLVKEGTKIKLYNSNTARVPGVNPIVFNSLEDYAEFVNWLKSQGINCPVLVLEESYDVQGNKTFTPNSDLRFLGAVSNDLIQMPYEGNGVSVTQQPIQPIVDASRDNPPFNTGDYQGYDPLNQQIGRRTILDVPTPGESPFATDPNWGGPEYSQKLIDSGEFDEDKVYVKRKQ